MTHQTAIAAMLIGPVGAAFAQPCAWEFFETPTITDNRHILYDLDGLADDNVWAVGTAQDSNFDLFTFAMRFDGVAWEAFATPNPSLTRGHNRLAGVVTLAPDDVIAVGAYTPDTSATQALAMRFDGTDWDRIDAPFIQGGSHFNDLQNVSGDLWGVGGRFSGQQPPVATGFALAARWTGSAWDLEPVPPLALIGGRSYNNLYAIDGASPDDVWGVGIARQVTPPPDEVFGPRTYMVHFDGSAWSLVQPDIGDRLFSGYVDVLAIERDDVYAVGWTYDDDLQLTQPLIAHFDGSEWSEVALPRFPEGPADLRAIAARSGDEVYALGTYADGNGSPRDLILRFDGAEWQRMPGAEGLQQEWFRTAVTLPSGHIWAGGQYLEPGVATLALAERLACTPGCAADIDGNGVVDADDFFGYLDLFAADDPAADIDGNNVIDADDFFGYLDLFAAGC